MRRRREELFEEGRRRREEEEGGGVVLESLKERPGGERLIKDLKRQASSLSRGSEQASTQGWRQGPHPLNTAPPRSELYPYSLGLC